MKFWMMILASLGTCAVGGDIDCGSGEARYRLAWQEALAKHGDRLTPDTNVLEELETMGGGYSYRIYFNTKPKGGYARSVLVIMDEACKVLHVDDTPRESRLILTEAMK